MKIVGGSYRELCDFPERDLIYGSGGRAAVALSGLSPNSELHTYSYREWVADVAATMKSFAIEPHIIAIDEPIEFEYFHPLRKVRQFPEKPTRQEALTVKGEVVLAFGFVEGAATIDADFAVYDPQISQSSSDAAPFAANGSKASNLTIIVNEQELPDTGDLPSKIEAVQAKHGSKFVIVKRRAGGATVFVGDMGPQEIPAYWADTFCKIGTGDVFAAAYAHYWGERRMDAITAADLASRSMSYFADGQSLPIPSKDQLPPMRQVKTAQLDTKKIYLAGPVVGITQLWLASEAVDNLDTLGIGTFWPYRDVDLHLTTEEQRDENLKGMKECSAVLALATDEKPIFEVAEAIASGLPVVIFCEPDHVGHIKMRYGNAPRYVTDFVTALYHACWLSTEPPR